MKNLKILRNQAKITQIDAAKIFNMSLRGYQDIENGVNETSYTNLVRFADYFGCSIDYLLEHETPGIIHLDSYTETQKTLIGLVGKLNEDQANHFIGRMAEVLNIPYSSIKPVRPW